MLQGQPLEHENLIFHDKDSPAVNHYDIKVLNDPFNTLKPNCKLHENDYHGNAQTAIACSKYNKNLMQWSNAIYQNVINLTLCIKRSTDSYWIMNNNITSMFIVNICILAYYWILHLKRVFKRYGCICACICTDCQTWNSLDLIKYWVV